MLAELVTASCSGTNSHPFAARCAAASAYARNGSLHATGSAWDHVCPGNASVLREHFFVVIAQASLSRTAAP